MKKISIVQYEKDEEINRYFSIITDVRIIWGETIPSMS